MKKSIREAVHRKYDGHCAYCGKVIQYKEMQVDHIYPKARYGYTDVFDIDGINNLNPSCRRCNHYKRSGDLEDFRRLMLTLHKRVADTYISKVAIDYGLIEIKPFNGKFYFEEREK